MEKARQPLANERQLYGGQAVVEGVMMRSPRYFAVACRRETDGAIVIERENVETVFSRVQWLNKPFLRGTLALIDSFYMGTKALMYSANVQADTLDVQAGQAGSAEASGSGLSLVDGAMDAVAPIRAEGLAAGAVDVATGQGVFPRPKPRKQDLTGPIAPPAAPGTPPINGMVIGATVVVSFLFAMAMFWLLPTLVTELFERLGHWDTAHLSYSRKVYANLSDGIIRIVVFLAYIAAISRMERIQRVFQYHGAEHKAINTLEAGEELTLENARKSSRIHPRCGTNFIFIVLVVSIVVFSLVGRPPIWIRGPLHLLLLPVVAGISYEVLRFAGRNRGKKWANLLIAPGLATQYLTTRVPDDSQIEVALAALKSVWEKEHDQSDPSTVQEGVLATLAAKPSDEAAAAVA